MCWFLSFFISNHYMLGDTFLPDFLLRYLIYWSIIRYKFNRKDQDPHIRYMVFMGKYRPTLNIFRGELPYIIDLSIIKSKELGASKMTLKGSWRWASCARLIHHLLLYLPSCSLCWRKVWITDMTNISFMLSIAPWQKKKNTLS